jgi:hypothetical protein
MIGNPTKQEFAGMLHEKLIAYCPVTVQDVHNGNQNLVQTLLTLEARQLGQNQSTLGWIM